MKQAVSLVRKSIILCIGIPLIVLGIVFLVIPGPGLVLILLGLLVLSSEFVWAKVFLDKGKRQLEKIKSRAQKIK